MTVRTNSRAGHPAAPTLVFVGGGPRSTSLIERLAANSAELLGDTPLAIHVIDPFPPGGGRIWRRAQSPLLWMNSVAADVAMYTDESVTCDGPIVTGPTLAEWVAGVGRPILDEVGLGEVASTFSPQDFASRELQSHYLAWVFDRAVAELPPTVTVQVHAGMVVDVVDIAGTGTYSGQRVTLADGTLIDADVVVMAQGYLDREPTPSESELVELADARDVTYVPPGYTADLDLDGIGDGEPVIIRGFGLAFIDLMVRLGEERGGSFTRDPDGTLTYLPDGREAILYVGSRRGVPYHAKLSYVNLGAPPVAPRYFTPAALGQIFAATGGLDYDTHLWPLLVKELAHAHYRELCTVHPDRVEVDWPAFAERLDGSDVRSAEFLQWAASVVPAAVDRFEIDAIDRPLGGGLFADAADLTDTLRGYIAADVRRRADRHFSADLAVFNALLTVYGVSRQVISSGWISAADRIQRIEGDLHGFFSFMASGPPPQRLEELLALNAAGIVHFVGPDMRVELLDGQFVAESPSVPGTVRARTFIEGRLPKPDVLHATDPVIRSLLAAGELAVESAGESPSDDGSVAQSEGFALEGGQLLADDASRAKRADGSFHPRRFLLGPSVSGSLGSAGFSRPFYNSPFLRQNDAVARELIRLIQESAALRQIASAATDLDTTELSQAS